MASNNAEAVAESSDRLMIFQTAHTSNFTSRLTSLWQDDVFCDVVLQVEGKHFNCHKIILAANSPYFYSLLSNGMSETSQKVIELKDISSYIMENILNYIYFKDISLDVTQTIEMLKVVDMLQIENSLKEHIADNLIEKVANDNCLDILNLTSCIELPALWKVANEHALINFKTIWRMDALLDLSKDVITQYLGDDGLLVDKEENVFNSVCRWIEADFQMRKQYAPELFKTVRFCFIEPNILIDDIEEHPLMDQFPSLRKHVMAALRHQTTPCYQHQEHYYKCKPRLSNMTTILVCPTNDDMEQFPDLENVSVHFPETFHSDIIHLPSRFAMDYFTQSCLVGTMLYVCDGGKLRKYNTQIGNYSQNAWTKCASRRSGPPLSDFTFTLCGDFMYLIGGQKEDGCPTSNIDIYNWQKDVWETPEGFDVALLHPVHSHAAVALHGSIYIIGGICVDGTSSKFLQIYDTTEGKISMGPEMPTSQGWPCAVCFNNEIYSFSRASALKYTPAESKWSHLRKPSEFPMQYSQVTIFGEKVLIFGFIAGYPGAEDQDEILEYDITSDSYNVFGSVSPSFGPVPIGIVTLVNNSHLKWL